MSIRCGWVVGVVVVMLSRVRGAHQPGRRKAGGTGAQDAQAAAAGAAAVK